MLKSRLPYNMRTFHHLPKLFVLYQCNYLSHKPSSLLNDMALKIERQNQDLLERFPRCHFGITSLYRKYFEVIELNSFIKLSEPAAINGFLPNKISYFLHRNIPMKFLKSLKAKANLSFHLLASLCSTI
jgi:hypothetical protein